MFQAAAAAQTLTQKAIAPQQQKVVEAEAAAWELAARLEQNAEHLRELTELAELRRRLPRLEKEKNAAEAAYTVARQNTDQIVKQYTDRWPDHLLHRIRACDPEITTVSLSPEDFTVTINSSAFDARAAAGHAMTRINISTLLALRDTAREVPAMPMPQFLIADGPLTGLGPNREDQRTASTLLDGLADLAIREPPSGEAGQVVIACAELPGPPDRPSMTPTPASLTEQSPTSPPREPTTA